ncbi:MAG: DUF1297 domain-containing protein [Patescibacteria group bacterium]
MNSSELIDGYDLKKLTVGALGGHSALDICNGAKKMGFQTLVVAEEGREKTYTKYYRARKLSKEGTVGCVDDVIEVKKFRDILDRNVQDALRSKNTLFIHSRYFWVYFDDFARVENDFAVPIFGSRSLLKLEERDQPYNQYHLLKDAGIRAPKLFEKPEDIEIGRMVIVKAHEAKRGYERAFFLTMASNFEARANEQIKRGEITKEGLKEATIEEFVVGAPVNFNFFYSPLSDELELLGTDTRRQTNLDGFLRMTAEDQTWAKQFTPVKMIETGHIACTVKESILEKAFDLGERFVRATQAKKCDPTGRGIIGPFALQGAVVADEGREDIVIFDVSMRIPGSPGIRSTPYSGYLYGEPISIGERIGMEIRKAVREKALEKIIT